jgi:hypothetical protein
MISQRSRNVVRGGRTCLCVVCTTQQKCKKERTEAGISSSGVVATTGNILEIQKTKTKNKKKIVCI